MKMCPTTHHDRGDYRLLMDNDILLEVLVGDVLLN